MGACNSGTQACCSGLGQSYDASNCTTAIDYWCTMEIDAVNNGFVTYDPSYLAACQQRFGQFSKACSVNLITYLKNYVPCSQLFNGKTPPGGGCTTDADCHAPAGEVASCDMSNGMCRSYAIVGSGQGCTYAGNDIRLCDNGLYCDPLFRVCRTAKALGAACLGASDLSCGFGNTCSGGRCNVGAPAGASCTNSLQCASWSCQSNACTDPNVTVASWGLCGP
jgi:hypothetical protein